MKSNTFKVFMVSKSLLGKLKKVKFLILDVDGVLTDGRIIYDSKGRDAKFYDVHDGLGVYLLGRMGVKTVLITAKASGSIAPRAADMKVEAVFENILPKTKAYEAVLKTYKLRDDEVCFIGDDLVDICVMKRAGVPLAPANAVAEVKRLAVHVLSHRGGRGAVREAAELILKAKGLWSEALRIYQ
jgi:3-deoxy-D-manno-octulosonate 8-phosphate phosphatase (KDO 8-P phosphatase)